jgi:hypothetical protein
VAIAQAKARNAAKAKAAAAAKIQMAAAAAVEAQAQRAQAVKKLEDQIFIAKVVQFKKPTSDKIRDKVVHGIMELGMGETERLICTVLAPIVLLIYVLWI